MTTIAYRDGVMAADTGSVFSGTIMLQNMGKVVRGETPSHIFLGGCAGGSAICAGFRQWVLDGASGYPEMHSNGDDTHGSGLLAVLEKETGAVEVWLYEDDGAYRVNEDYVADGSGMDFALGVMWAGGDARMAVKAAIRFDVNSNGHVNSVSFARGRGRAKSGGGLGGVGGVSKGAKGAKTAKTLPPQYDPIQAKVTKVMERLRAKGLTRNRQKVTIAPQKRHKVRAP